MEARRAHNPEVVGSSPASATKKVPNSIELGTFLMPKIRGFGICIPLSNILLTFVFLNPKNWLQAWENPYLQRQLQALTWGDFQT